MSLIIATGSNLGDRQNHLNLAREILSKKFTFIAQSRIYESAAIDFLDQPDFFNQVLEFKTPAASPQTVMTELLQIEKTLGRQRNIPKGPRVIDLDILFWDDLHISTAELSIPHPRLFDRSFVVVPLAELPAFTQLKEKYFFKLSFDCPAIPISLFSNNNNRKT